MLKLFSANAASDFVSFIYDASEPFVAPFQGIFKDFGTLDVSAVVAMIVWAIIAALLAKALVNVKL